MKKKENKFLTLGVVCLAAFAIWTILIQVVDVQPFGTNGTDIGFATFNCWFHKITGVSMTIYTITDWLGIVPLLICMIFGVVGLVQWIRQKSLLKVDKDIMILEVYYIVVIMFYVVFEIFPINYRPILINGFMEASYPSSTTLLVLCVMPTLVEQINRRAENTVLPKVVFVFTVLFSAFMVIGRLLSEKRRWISRALLHEKGIVKTKIAFCIQNKDLGK